ncbi:HGGxSTG domain-containing protein [Roseobacter sp. EG26]|uniref:HGGxSTG domain-containing protein n=1 Tax=Roseobacter sp. EG26 TaxID=3412477 RepID=UPI003CE50213
MRRAQNFSQTEMAERIGCSRCAISYWETQLEVMNTKRIKRGVPAHMLEALGYQVLKNYCTPMRARGDGVLDGWRDIQQEALDRAVARENERLATKEAHEASRARVYCSAKTRKGHPCRLKSEPGKRRCKFHGGMSTGPKTAEGKARIAEAQRVRWAAYRAEKLSDMMESSFPAFRKAMPG